VRRQQGPCYYWMVWYPAQAWARGATAPLGLDLVSGAVIELVRSLMAEKGSVDCP